MRGSERFTQRASTAITKAHDAALGMGHSYVGTEHLLLGIIREGEGLGARILTDNALTDAVLTRMVTETVGRGVPGAPEQGLSPRARHVIELAAEDANRLGHCYVGTEHILMGILREADSAGARIIVAAGGDLNKIYTDIMDVFGRPEYKPRPQQGAPRAQPRRAAETKTLDQYGRDLTELAAAGRMDPVIGRDREIERAIQILSRRSKNNPVLIGEPGTGKEQIARYLYLHSSLANHPFIVVNCALLNEKTWDFLLNHYNSPLSATGNTIYFQNFESISPQWSSELLAAIEETGLARRVRLIFSCSIVEGEPVPEVLRHFSERLGSLALPLPSLRSRSDEIPSLSSLYLNSLNLELGKQLSGFEPRAIEMLRQYPWPNNYTQFKNVLRALAALSDGPYIRAGTVADMLSKERTLRAVPQPASARKPSEQTLEEVIRDVVQQAVAAHGGNRAAAARQLGISRTTLWRYMEKIEQKQQNVEKES